MIKCCELLDLSDRHFLLHVHVVNCAKCASRLSKTKKHERSTGSAHKHFQYIRMHSLSTENIVCDADQHIMKLSLRVMLHGRIFQPKYLRTAIFAFIFKH